MISPTLPYHPHSLSRDDTLGPDTDILFHRVDHTGPEDTAYYSLRSIQGHTLQRVGITFRKAITNFKEAGWSTYYQMTSELP